MDLKTYKIIAAICVIVCFHISSNAAQAQAANDTKNGNGTTSDPSSGSNQASGSKPDQSQVNGSQSGVGPGGTGSGSQSGVGSGGTGSGSSSSVGSGGTGSGSQSGVGSGGTGSGSQSGVGSGGTGSGSPSSGGSGGTDSGSQSGVGSGSAAGNTCLEGTCSESDEKKAYDCFAKLAKTCPLTAQGSCTTTITKTAQNTTEIKVGCHAGACPDPPSTTTAVTSTCCSTNQCNKYQPADSSAEIHYIGLLAVLTSILFHLTLNYL